MSWSQSRVSDDRTHHLIDGRPMYTERFEEVLAFHAPGLAPARNGSDAFHIDPSGLPAYAARFQRTFGFYEGLAAAIDHSGWLHIRADGSPAYHERHAWAGNFQDGRCAVRFADRTYGHLRPDGAPAYAERYRYAGDFREGIAVVVRFDGLHVHVDRDGQRVSTGEWLDLGPFHKGFATACDESGWTHVDRAGRPAYADRYAAVEPFYNGQARVLDEDGGLHVIDEHGRRVVELRPARTSALQRLSAQMVGLWSTYAVRTGVELGIFDALPATEPELVRVTGAPEVRRLMMALRELGLVRNGADWTATERGQLLRRSDPSGMADASAHWASDTQRAWAALPAALRSREVPVDWFASLSTDPEAVASYQRAMAGYARHDYADLADVIPEHRVFVDAGGGTGVLLSTLLRRHAQSRGVLLDRAEVVRLAELPNRAVAFACDIRHPWPVTADAVLLARVLHDWPDDVALEILRRARKALYPGGRLYVVELGRRNGSPSGALLDMHLFAMTGGQERTVEELSRMIEGVGFQAPTIHANAACVLMSSGARPV